MANCYSGRYLIEVIWSDRWSLYECLIQHAAEKHAKLVCVRPPAVLQCAVDSPEAYDAAARAALSFASEGGQLSDGEVDVGETGFIVTRKAERDHKGRRFAKAAR